MRINLSFKDATSLLDQMIKEGAEMLDGWWDSYRKLVASGESEADQLMDRMISEKEIWMKRCKSQLEEIFQDFTPLYLFDVADHSPKDASAEPLALLHGLGGVVRKKLEVLTGLYQQLAPFSRSPLIYLKEKAQLVYYSRIIQLKPDVNESDLCRFMFEKAFGEWVEVFALYKHLTGEAWMREAEQANLVVNAARSINKKTKESLGFGIFKLKKKESICLVLPPKFAGADF